MQIFRKLKFLSVCIFMLLSVGIKAEKPITINLPPPIDSLKFFVGSSNDIIEKVATLPDSAFKNFEQTSIEKKKDFWVKITINNKLAVENNYILHFNSTIDYISLYQQNNGQWTEQNAGVYIPENERTLDGFIKDKVPISISDQDQTILYLKINDRWGETRDIEEMTLLPAKKFNRWLNKTYQLQFLFLGIIIVLCLFSSILFLFTHERIYIYYAIYTFLAGVYFSYYFQILETGFFSNQVKLYNYLFFSVLINQAMYCWFLYEAFRNNGSEKIRAFIRKFAWSISAAVLGIMVLSVFNQQLAIFLSDICSMVIGLFAFFIFFGFFRKVKNTVKIILIGSIFLVVGGLAAIIANSYKNAISHIYIYQSGFLIELLFFSVAINLTHYNERLEKLKTSLENLQLEAEKLRKEKEANLLREKINLQNRELATKAVMISQKESMIKDVSNHLKDEVQNGQDIKSGVRKIIQGLNSPANNNYWDEFEMHFTRVHPNFYQSLNKLYPGLTANERKICAFLKLNLTTKEISNITKRNPESIHMARSRLRKKMGLNKTENLEILISEIN